MSNTNYKIKTLQSKIILGIFHLRMDYKIGYDQENNIGYIRIYRSLTQKAIEEINKQNIKILSFQGFFDFIPGIIPECVEEVQIVHSYYNYGSFNQNLSNLPFTIKRISVFNQHYQNGYKNLPPNLEELCIETSTPITDLSNLPDNLVKLIINAPLDDSVTFDHLPSKLQFLSIGYHCNLLKARLDNLPESLKALEIRANFEFPIENLPIHLETLVIENDNFNSPITNLPVYLKDLIISSNKFQQTITRLPSNLKQLAINYAKQDIEINDLPETLQYLFLNASEDDTNSRQVKINLVKFPAKLEQIGLGILHKQITSQIQIPLEIKVFNQEDYY